MKLYTYDHCPFCVRARMIFGLHQIPFEEIVLLNDDEATPISMIGVKQVPILQKDDGSYMGESLDIVNYIDKQASTGHLNHHIRPEIETWLAQIAPIAQKLVQPRNTQAGLAEFATQSAINYFTHKKEQSIGSFAENIANTAALLAQIHPHLIALEPLIISSDGLNGKASLEDILVFPWLRNLTIVKDLHMPPKVADYVHRMSELSQVPLLSARAI